MVLILGALNLSLIFAHASSLEGYYFCVLACDGLHTHTPFASCVLQETSVDIYSNVLQDGVLVNKNIQAMVVIDQTHAGRS